MAKKSTIITATGPVEVTPTKKPAAKKAPAKKAAVKRPAKTVATKPVILKDKNVKELLDHIAQMQVDLDKANKDLEVYKTEDKNRELVVNKLQQEKSSWESKCNDIQIEYNSQKRELEICKNLANRLEKELLAQQNTKDVLAQGFDQATTELEAVKGLYNDALTKAKYNGELLQAKQRELENTNINYVKLNNLHNVASTENTQLKKQLETLKNKWHVKLFGF